jgi:hypothetical protein
MVWTTEADAGRMLSVPPTTMFLVEARVAEASGSKASRPPACTVTPATWVWPVTVTVVPLPIVAGSPAPGTRPPLQVDGSDQAPDPTLWRAGAALVDGITRTSPAATRTSPRATETITSVCREALAAC